MLQVIEWKDDAAPSEAAYKVGLRLHVCKEVVHQLIHRLVWRDYPRVDDPGKALELLHHTRFIRDGALLARPN
jgi:hypothetical protein